jgi:hypothetical protein
MSAALVELSPECMGKTANVRLYHPANTSMLQYACMKPTRYVLRNKCIYHGNQGFGMEHRIDLLNIPGADGLGALSIEYVVPAIRHRSEEKVECRGNSSSSSKALAAKKANSNGHIVYYVQSAGHIISEEVYLQTATGQFLMHNYDWLEICDELMNPSSHSNDECVGRAKAEKTLWKNSRSKQRFLIQLHFWFCELVQCIVPLYLIDKNNKECNKLDLVIKTASVDKVYYSSDGTVPRLMDSSVDLCKKDLEVRVFADLYNFTDAEKMDRKRNAVHDFLFHEIQYHHPKQIDLSEAKVPGECKLDWEDFHGPISGIYMVVSREQNIADKDYFNWSGEEGGDPIDEMEFRIGKEKDPYISKRSSLWYRTHAYRRRHTNQPNKHIYYTPMSHFCEKPNVVPGSVFLEKAKTQAWHQVTFERNLGACCVKAFAVRPQTFRITDGKIHVFSDHIN